MSLNPSQALQTSRYRDTELLGFVTTFELPCSTANFDFPVNALSIRFQAQGLCD